MIVRCSEPKGFLGLLVVLAMLMSWALSGLAHGSSSTLAALERVPVHTTDRDEPEEDRKKRLREIADGIDGATADRLKRAMLVVLGRYESHFARDVCSGERLGDKGKAYGCFQGWVPENERGGGRVAGALVSRSPRDGRQLLRGAWIRLGSRSVFPLRDRAHLLSAVGSHAGATGEGLGGEALNG